MFVITTQIISSVKLDEVNYCRSYNKLDFKGHLAFLRVYKIYACGFYLKYKRKLALIYNDLFIDVSYRSYNKLDFKGQLALLRVYMIYACEIYLKYKRQLALIYNDLFIDVSLIFYKSI